MSKKLLLLSSAFLMLTISASAQFGERIISGRPGQANGARSVGSGVYQLQSGIDFNNARTRLNDSLSLTNENSNQNSVFRIGLFEKTEFRLGYGYQIKDENNSAGVNAIAVGIRQNFLSQQGIIPTTALQATVNFGGIDQFQQDHPNYQLRLLLGHNISKNLSLNTNVSWNYISNSENINTNYVFSFSYSLTDNLNVLGEIYGDYNAPEEDWDTYLDAGLAYLIGNNFQLDVYGGYSQNSLSGENLTTESFFVSSGISYRLVDRK